MHIEKMLGTSPTPPVLTSDRLAACIEACFDCAQTCTACADACLGEDMVAQLVACIRQNADCADVCLATGRILSRTQGDRGLLRAQLDACRLACQLCAAECEKHAHHHEHCRICAESCRACENACRDVIAATARGRA